MLTTQIQLIFLTSWECTRHYRFTSKLEKIVFEFLTELFSFSPTKLSVSLLTQNKELTQATAF